MRFRCVSTRRCLQVQIRWMYRIAEKEEVFGLWSSDQDNNQGQWWTTLRKEMHIRYEVLRGCEV